MRNAAPDPPALIPGPALLARFHGGFARLHRPAEGERIGIAVSGGPDSLALLLLARAAWPDRVEAATVDHGLRAESAGEAEAVAAICARIGMPHATLAGPWNAGGRDGLQAEARAYRYRMLAGWCRDRGLAILATAHHADDQAETLLMRLARGAGVGGLGGIRAARRLTDGDVSHPVTLVRPLLGFAKAELCGIVAAAGLVAAEDRSNDDPRYDRTHARRLLADADWLRPARLAAAASHLADADDALWWAAHAAARERIVREDVPDGPVLHGDWLIDPRGLPRELTRRVVALLIEWMEDDHTAGNPAPRPAGPKLIRFIERLEAGESATLGHVLARPGAVWRFTVAPPRKT